MSRSYRKSRPLNRSEEYVRDTNLIIIATEGNKREPHYFTMDLFMNNKKIQIQLIPAFDNKSSPNEVLNKLHEYASEFQFAEDDQFWLVIDKDRWDKAGLYEIINLCNVSNYSVALSNPCFELWLLLHFRKVDELELTENMSCTDIKNIFNPNLPTETREVMKQLLPGGYLMHLRKPRNWTAIQTHHFRIALERGCIN